MAKIVVPMTEDANTRKCFRCGVKLAVKAKIADCEVTVTRGAIFDDKFHMFCSWWCKDQFEKEKEGE